MEVDSIIKKLSAINIYQGLRSVFILIDAVHELKTCVCYIIMLRTLSTEVVLHKTQLGTIYSAILQLYTGY